MNEFFCIVALLWLMPVILIFGVGGYQHWKQNKERENERNH